MLENPRLVFFDSSLDPTLPSLPISEWLTSQFGSIFILVWSTLVSVMENRTWKTKPIALSAGAGLRLLSWGVPLILSLG